MTVLVTGGTGLVGRHVIAALAARHTTIRALARSDTAARELRRLGAEPVMGDLTDGATIAAAIAGADTVVHAGAVVLSRRGWDHYHATNVAATERIARACAHHRARLLYISSVAVYGRRTTYDGGPGSVTEAFGLDRPMFAGDHYARSKREAEQAVWRVAEATGLAAVALRPCVIYGEGDRAFAIRVARTLQRHRVAPLLGDGSNPLAVVYAGNVAAAVTAALDRPAVTGAFNVANDGAITQREFLEIFARGLNRPLAFVRIPLALAWGAAALSDTLMRRLRPGAPMATLKTAVQFLAQPNPFVSQKAVTALGWHPMATPADAVLRTAQWYAAGTG